MFAVDRLILYLCLVTMFIDKQRFYCVSHRLDFELWFHDLFRLLA